MFGCTVHLRHTKLCNNGTRATKGMTKWQTGMLIRISSTTATRNNRSSLKPTVKLLNKREFIKAKQLNYWIKSKTVTLKDHLHIKRSLAHSRNLQTIPANQRLSIEVSGTLQISPVKVQFIKFTIKKCCPPNMKSRLRKVARTFETLYGISLTQHIRNRNQFFPQTYSIWRFKTGDS